MLSRMSLRLSHRTLTTTSNVPEILAFRRSLHYHTCKLHHNNGLSNSSILGLSKQKPILAATFIRYASSGNNEIPDELLHSIPDSPVPPAPEVLDIVQGIGDPALSTLGLGGYTPVGLVQSALEWLHIAGDLPWWGTIVIGTVCVRVMMFPLVLKAQRNAAKLHNVLPQMQLIQAKITEARETGNDYDSARYTQELSLFMKEKGINLSGHVLVPLAQAPLFISFFMALRQMSNAPVPSMRDGGLWWFLDLTVPDQYYLLPIITCSTMYMNIALGVDGMNLNALGSGVMVKYFFKALPLVTFPFIMNFNGAILCYWVSTNFISLIQTGVLKVPAVRRFFKIAEHQKHDPSQLIQKDKGFVKGFKESLSNMKKVREMSDRGFMDRMEFERAGKGALPKTYKYDPTKQVPSPPTILAKKRN